MMRCESSSLVSGPKFMVPRTSRETMRPVRPRCVRFMFRDITPSACAVPATPAPTLLGERHKSRALQGPMPDSVCRMSSKVEPGATKAAGQRPTALVSRWVYGLPVTLVMRHGHRERGGAGVSRRVVGVGVYVLEPARLRASDRDRVDARAVASRAFRTDLRGRRGDTRVARSARRTQAPVGAGVAGPRRLDAARGLVVSDARGLDADHLACRATIVVIVGVVDGDVLHLVVG